MNTSLPVIEFIIQNKYLPSHFERERGDTVNLQSGL